MMKVIMTYNFSSWSLIHRMAMVNGLRLFFLFCQRSIQEEFAQTNFCHGKESTSQITISMFATMNGLKSSQIIVYANLHFICEKLEGAVGAIICVIKMICIQRMWVMISLLLGNAQLLISLVLSFIFPELAYILNSTQFDYQFK